MRQRVALYARFSSDLQNPTSASDQLRGLRLDIARRQPEWEIVAEERDEAVSGTSMEGRDGLRRLLTRAATRPRPFDAIVVEDLSRLARNRSDSMRMRDQLAASGVSILSAADGFVDPESDAGLFLTGIKEIKAEADSRETGRRVRRGVKARTALGWVSGRKTPFGYLRVPVFSDTERDRDGRPVRLGVRFEPDPKTAAIVTLIFRRYAEGVGLRRIAAELNDPAGPYRAAKPKGFITSFLRPLLLNPVYVGRVVYARTQEKKVRVGESMKRRKVRVAAVDQAVKEHAHEPLIDEETWATVQAGFDRRRGTGALAAAAAKGVGRAPASLLSGIVQCGVCGGGFVVWTSGPNPKQHARGMRDSTRRFVCGRRRSSGSDVCSNASSILVARLERVVLDAVEARVLTAEGLTYLDGRRREYLREGLEALSVGEPAVEREWADVTAAEARLIEAIKSGMRLDSLQNEAERLRVRGAELERERGRLVLLRGVQAAAIGTRLETTRLTHLREILSLADLAHVRVALAGLVARVEIGGDGGVSLLMGDGPLEPLPPELHDGFGPGALGGGRSHTADGGGATSNSRDVPGAGPFGHRPGSRLCVVGATGFEPATS